MDINQATAAAIKAERAIAGLTVRQLSQRSGIPMSSLMRVLGAEREIKVNQVAQIAVALEVYPHEIIETAENLMARSGPPVVKAVPLRGEAPGDQAPPAAPRRSRPGGR